MQGGEEFQEKIETVASNGVLLDSDNILASLTTTTRIEIPFCSTPRGIQETSRVPFPSQVFKAANAAAAGDTSVSSGLIVVYMTSVQTIVVSDVASTPIFRSDFTVRHREKTNLTAHRNTMEASRWFAHTHFDQWHRGPRKHHIINGARC
jgi:hypothetical protein